MMGLESGGVQVVLVVCPHLFLVVFCQVYRPPAAIQEVSALEAVKRHPVVVWICSS